jgi:hypothetical protein
MYELFSLPFISLKSIYAKFPSLTQYHFTSLPALALRHLDFNLVIYPYVLEVLVDPVHGSPEVRSAL